MWIRQVLIALIGWWVPAGHMLAAPCLHIAGIVEDQITHRPLGAQLYVKTPTGRILLGGSAAGSGLFSVDVPCPASILFVEKAGYRPQQLRLNPSVSENDKNSVAFIIPLTAVDPLDIDKPYLQTEQTHYEQRQSANAGRWQHHNKFTIKDVRSGQSLVARACFFFTKSGRKTCLDTGEDGQVMMSFPEKDIVAMEVTAAGYQPYQGNLIIEEPTVKYLHHTIHLTQELTLLTIQSDIPGDAELRPLDSGSPTFLRAVPGQRNLALTSQALPRDYTLVLYESDRTIREKRTIRLKAGLNSIRISSAHKPVHSSVASITPDSLPTLYFDQGSYILRPETKTVLHSIAAYMSKNPAQRIQLVGHADPEGDPRLNYSLAENRVKVITVFLCSQGILEGQIESVSHGSRYPVAPSNTEENKVRNRRVQMRFIH